MIKLIIKSLIIYLDRTKNPYRPIFLMNTDVENLNKMLEKWIQEHTKKIICHD